MYFSVACIAIMAVLLLWDVFKAMLFPSILLPVWDTAKQSVAD
jgi:hypothetical protein